MTEVCANLNINFNYFSFLNRFPTTFYNSGYNEITVSENLCGAKDSCLYRLKGTEEIYSQLHHPRNRAKRYHVVQQYTLHYEQPS